MQLKHHILDIQHNVDLKPYTSFAIGGLAESFCVIHNLDQLPALVDSNYLGKGSYHILGGGSNILINDQGIKRPVIYLGPEFDYIEPLGNAGVLKVGAATSLAKLIDYCIVNELQGVEGLSGIPAKIGGLIISGAASFGTQIKDCLRAVTIFDFNQCCLKHLEAGDISFGDHQTNLEDCLVLEAVFCLHSEVDIKQKVIDILNNKIKTQDLSHPSAGCIFKNSKQQAAGALIDACGLKDFRVNDACVSSKHANFIINQGSARTKDVTELIEVIKRRVKEQFEITLIEEIKRWDC
jgi:UDP-N-acetylmuramate dehydrogenase